jgi:hypothetical protein
MPDDETSSSASTASDAPAAEPAAAAADTPVAGAEPETGPTPTPTPTDADAPLAAPAEDPTAPADDAAGAEAAAPAVAQTSLAAPKPVVTQGLSYAVDIVFCIDVTGSMTPIIDAVKDNALRFYDDVQTNLTDKGKNVDELRVRVIAFRDFVSRRDAALEESPFLHAARRAGALQRVRAGLLAAGWRRRARVGLEAVALPSTRHGPPEVTGAVRSSSSGTDQPATPLDRGRPTTVARRVPADFSGLTDLWEDARRVRSGRASQAPDPVRTGRSGMERHLRSVGERRAHPSQAGGGCRTSTTARSSTPSALGVTHSESTEQ